MPTGKLVRGALATVVRNQIDTLVAFQYNPESIKRSVTPQMGAGDSSDHSNESRFTDAPTQRISFTAYFDAADALEKGDSVAVQSGIGPQLALLERLVYPLRSQIEDRDRERNSGVMEVVALTAPSFILIWGPKRAIPVRISQLEITEEAFDGNLNPIRASIAISVDVQTYAQRTPDDDDYRRFGAYHTRLERLSKQVGEVSIALPGGL